MTDHVVHNQRMRRGMAPVEHGRLRTAVTVSLLYPIACSEPLERSVF